MSDSGSRPLDNASKDANENMSPAPAGSPTQSCGSAPEAPAAATVSPEKKSWIAIALFDAENKSVPGEDYKIVLPDGTSIEGNLDGKGRAKIQGIDPGTCKISFPNRDKNAWNPK
jgi:hypothetical protein